MPDIVYIDTLDDPRLDAYTRLTELQLRSRLEPEKGIFIAESAKVIERALIAGMAAESFLMGERWLEPMGPLLERVGEDVPVFVAPMDLMEKLTGFNVTRGALCACRRPKLPDPADLLHGARRIAVLEGVSDHTNVGAIFRSAAALNVDAVLVDPTCCDPLYRRAARVSMGAVFQVPWTRFAGEASSWRAPAFELLRETGFITAALSLDDDSISLDDPGLAGVDRLALFLGSEGHGLPDSTVSMCDMAIRIPMSHGVDSLNVAAASAVAFWQLCPHPTNDYEHRRGLFG